MICSARGPTRDGRSCTPREGTVTPSRQGLPVLWAPPRRDERQGKPELPPPHTAAPRLRRRWDQRRVRRREEHPTVGVLQLSGKNDRNQLRNIVKRVASMQARGSKSCAELENLKSKRAKHFPKYNCKKKHHNLERRHDQQSQLKIVSANDEKSALKPNEEQCHCVGVIGHIRQSNGVAKLTSFERRNG